MSIRTYIRTLIIQFPIYYEYALLVNSCIMYPESIAIYNYGYEGYL